MSLARKIFSNSLFLVIADFFPRFVNAFVAVYLARILGPAHFGQIGFGVTIWVYLTQVSNMGLSTIGAREVAAHPAQVREYAGSISLLRGVFSLIGIALLLGFTFFHRMPEEKSHLVLLYGLGIFPAAIFLDWAFQGLEEMSFIACSRIISVSLYSTLIFVFIQSEQNLLLVPGFQVGSDLIGALFLLAVFRSKLGAPLFSLTGALPKALLTLSFPIGISDFLIQIIQNSGGLLLGLIRSDYEMGCYFAANRVTALILLFYIAYFRATFPVVARFFQGKSESLQDLHFFSNRLMLTITLPLGFIGAFFGTDIMALVFGAKFSEGGIAFSLLAWAFVLATVNSTYAWTLCACGGQVAFARIVTFQATGSLLMNLTLIPFIGLPGACLGNIFAEIIGLPLYHKELKPIVTVPFFGHLWKPLGAAALMGLVFLGIPRWQEIHHLSLIILGIIVYTGTLFILGGFSFLHDAKKAFAS